MIVEAGDIRKPQHALMEFYEAGADMTLNTALHLALEENCGLLSSSWSSMAAIVCAIT